MKIDKATKVCISISEFPGTSGATIHNSLCKVDGLGALASKAGGDGCFYAGGNRKYSPVSFDSYSSDNVELFGDKEFTELLNSSIINKIYSLKS